MARILPEHRQRLLQRPDARVHLHRGAETVRVGCRVSAPAALADDDGIEVHAERLANTGLHTTIGRAAADHQGGPSEEAQQLGHARAVERARATLEEDVVRGPWGDFVREAGLRRALDTV